MRAAILGALASLVRSLAIAPAAGADTTFGSDPAQPVTPLSCSDGAPIYIEIHEFFTAYEGTSGSSSCVWSWSNPAIGTDIVPFPLTGGTGTVTSVALPAMPDPGPMAVVVLTAALSAGSSSSHPDFVCCQVKQVGPEFEVPANQVTMEPLALHVSATEEANLSNPGETSFSDLVGVAVLSPTASLPIRYTGATSIGNADVASACYPAPGGANAEYKPPFNEYGFQLLARFTVAIDPSAPPPIPAPAPAGGGAGGGGGEPGGGGGEPEPEAEPAAGGVRLGARTLRPGGDGGTLTFGKVTNPPTVTTTQRLTALAGGRAGGRVAPHGEAGLVYGRARTTVAAGHAKAMKLRLNGRARRLLKRHRTLRARLTVVATNAHGERQKVARKVTIKPAKTKKGKQGRR